MIGDAFVINAVVHAYNLHPDNVRAPNGEFMRNFLFGVHSTWNPPGTSVPAALFQADQPMEVLLATNLLESPVDLVVNHTLRLDSMFHDGLCSHAKNVEAARRWPQRVISYVGVDPTAGLETCLRELDQQLDELPDAVGLKLYPDQVSPYRTWRMDDPDLAYPLFERARERGLRSVAVHKALPNGPVPLNPYRLDDLDGPAARFPDLNFEIVHGGMAFVEETAHAIARFPNVYANLEITSSLLVKAPGQYQEVLAQLLFWGGPSKLLYSDGALLVHPRPLLEAFWNLQLDEALLHRYGLPQLTAEDKAAILGGNYARMIGLDVEEAKRRLAGDEFDLARAAGPVEPYSSWRAHSSAVAS